MTLAIMQVSEKIIMPVTNLFVGVVLGLAVSSLFAQAQAQSQKEVTLRQAAGEDVRWILPGPRRLDPEIFGTPDNPLGFEENIGVPVKARLLNDNGTAFTTTAGPTPMSDRHVRITGAFQARLRDHTRVDTRASQDSAEGEFSFTDPSGSIQYRVVLKKLLNVGPVHRFFGGVLVDGFHHGKTSFGTRLVPTTYTYGALWGVADLYVNGEKVSDNRIIHMMATEKLRSFDNDGYRLLFDSELPHKGVHLHLVLPNTIITPQGPRPQSVPTGFMLPNGVEQPFLYIMFESVELEGLPILQ